MLHTWKRKFRQATQDFPLSVHYFLPLQIAEKHKPYSRHGQLEFLLVHRGTVELRTPEALYTLHAGDIAMISPYLLHSFRSVSMDVIELSLRFSPELIELFPDHFFQKSFLSPLCAGKLQLPTVLTADHPAHGAIYQALSQLHPDKEDTPGYKEQLLLAAFTGCLCIAPYCRSREEEPRTQDSPVDTCIRFLDRNYQKKLTLAEIADHVGLHPNYLCALFREVTGQSVFAYLHRLRLEYAKRLLGTTELSVSEVAQQCGFHSPGFFRKKYREFTGMTPQRYHKTYYNPQG